MPAMTHLAPALPRLSRPGPWAAGLKLRASPSALPQLRSNKEETLRAGALRTKLPRVKQSLGLGEGLPRAAFEGELTSAIAKTSGGAVDDRRTAANGTEQDVEGKEDKEEAGHPQNSDKSEPSGAVIFLEKNFQRAQPALAHEAGPEWESPSDAQLSVAAAAASAAVPPSDAEPTPKAKAQTGLRRAPSTGGVQSATQSHGLVDPHVAVRNLVAQSRHGYLCSVMSQMHHRRTGYPFASLIDFATDAQGHPIFSLSPLSIHARNLLADPRCTLVVQIPGWSGLADARVTLFGEVYPVSSEAQGLAKGIFCSRHKQEHSASWGNSYFFRMAVIQDIYFVGGFGTVCWIDTAQYMSVQPDKIASQDSEATLETLNAKLGVRLRNSLDSLVQGHAAAVEQVTFIAVDSKGVDIRVQQGNESHVRRLSFESPAPVESVEEALVALDDMLQRSALPLDLVKR